MLSKGDQSRKTAGPDSALLKIYLRDKILKYLTVDIFLASLSTNNT
jgi:hypothetical protein